MAICEAVAEPKLPEAVEALLRQRIEQGALELPVLPEVAAQVVGRAGQEDCDLKALAELIRRDQAMAAHLLRIANSPLYAPRTKIVSLQQALSRLGMRTIREIALLISVKTRAFRVDGFEREVSELFRHSLGTAIYAQEIARMRRTNVEEAFLAGLLHDVGRPVLLQTLLDLHQELKLRPERDAIGAAATAHHARVGSLLVASWSLPAALAMAILAHHDPTPPRETSSLVPITSLADELAHATLAPKPTEESAVRGHRTLLSLNLYPEDVDKLLAMRERISDMVGAIA